MKTTKRIVSAVLCVLMIGGVLPLTSFAAYENTHANTGNQIEDLIAVATTQIGYTEGNSVSAGTSGTTGGSGNYTKYGAWYGINPGAWCAMFVSWCANQAGIPSSIIPKHASCDIGMQWFQNNSRWQWSRACGGSYTPKRGDIIYFRTNTSQVTDSTHVGIVYSSDSSYVYTIEGNASNKCQKKSYALTSAYILGYGVPNYTSGSTGYSTGTYKITASSLNMRNLPTTSGTTVLQALPNGAQVAVTQVSNGWGYCTYNGISGWISLSYCTLVQSTTSYTITMEPNGGTLTSGSYTYQATPGQTYSQIMGGALPTAKRNGYDFRDWYSAEYDYILGLGGIFSVTKDATFEARWDAKLGVYTITTNSDPLNMRDGAGSSFNTIGQVPKGTKVNITTIYGDWGYCTYNGVSGWVSLAYCTYYGPATSVTETYTLTLNPDGGTMPSGVSTTYEFEPDEKFVDVIGLFPVPTRANYTFIGWQWGDRTDHFWKEGWGTQPYYFGADITLTARWEAHTHSYTSTVTKQATCTAAGTRTYTCTGCGNTYTESITKLAHSYTSSVTKQPTCGATGIKTYTCSSCGYSYTETIASTGTHTYTSKVTKAATCTAAGIKTFTCTCGTSYTETIAVLGHDYVNHPAQTASCTQIGWYSYQTCSRCTYTTYKQIPAGSHGYIYSDGTVSCGGCGLAYNGFFNNGDTTYYCVNGTPKTGLFTVDGDIYYASNTGALTKGTVVVITAAEKGSILTGSDSPYSFASDGKLVKTGFVTYGGSTYYYANTAMAKGLTKVDNDYYYFNDTTGVMLTNTTVTVSSNSYGLAAGNYLVRPDGKLYFSDVNATLSGDKILVDGVEQANGLFNIGGKYYYATEDGTIAKSGARYIYYTNGLLDRAYYYFNADGSIMDTGWLKLDDGRTYYFKNTAHCRGLHEIDGEYYFFNTETSEMVKNCDIWVDSNSSNGYPTGIYTFGANGKKVTPVTQAAETSVATATATLMTTGYSNAAETYVENATVMATEVPALSLPHSNDDADDSEE